MGSFGIFTRLKCKTNAIPILMKQTNEVSSVMLRPNKNENPNKDVKTVIDLIKTKHRAMKLNQVCKKIELSMRKRILRFETNL
jgi:hypothetical protein